MSENNFIEQGVGLVQKAIEADNAAKEPDEYEAALNLYKDALQRLTLGLKYEKNEARKKLLMERVGGYMKRAEELKDHIDKESGANQNDSESSNPQSGGSPSKEGGEGERKELDAETQKLRGALAGAVVAEKPNVRWDDIAGLEGAKESLKETVILPVMFPQLFVGERKPFKGILLFGPPGTGKSFLAKAVATESNSTFFSVSSADLISKWQGESEKLVRNLFEMARESEGSRAIIFIDEVDSLCGTRSEGEADSSRRVKTEFLVQMDGVGKAEGSVLILGASNVPWDLDAAIRRRFEKRVYISLPGPSARTYMFKMNTGDTPNNLTDADFDKLGKMSEGASGSDIEVIVKEALMEPLRRCQQAKQFFQDENDKYWPCEKYPNCYLCTPKLTTDPPDTDYDCQYCGAKRMTLWDVPPEKLDAPPVRSSDFENVMKHAFSTVSEEELNRYKEWTAMFGQEGA
ncbi:Protein SUPPRESSOR OF K(+) TRANSPORT GROWTH DEFECT 1 [Seminavis robusta]|uniref:vesicle-fusing ATPase n=1 Tax=Seminavis robusta TaxID=568900 RepID=A0A9N8EFI7_9STRA|nr:Protein SUPPRESSOR OF K(+) TRANSPORT GROWTH DEFECT 1 [Seminavis robusta]|eukprot:Sro1049_g235390.1 Protein SUPPRESSOR OF K(+) TRANSPORT GROWTH DEFECT 1 (461) ;mRNA; f:16756-18317